MKGKRLRELCVKKGKKRETAKVRTQGLAEGNGQGGDLGTPKTNSQGEDPRTFKEPVERWRVQKKWKEKKWKKKKKEKKEKVKSEEAVCGKRRKIGLQPFLRRSWKNKKKRRAERVKNRHRKIVFPHAYGTVLAVSMLQQKDCSKGTEMMERWQTQESASGRE